MTKYTTNDNDNNNLLKMVNKYEMLSKCWIFINEWNEIIDGLVFYPQCHYYHLLLADQTFDRPDKTDPGKFKLKKKQDLVWSDKTIFNSRGADYN